ncbi:hypothetical protein KIN20_003091 [Parelaphostrongylus tenuis]|uniref:H15 domain-containing protein n=1 Tax=Parelaphostrongylus tenuis TaxID=148309 RepID=A0AAD5MHT1_PARTN|nr:hypothetical protein KIN20_003091 [Parelaphostrongylus tenuis]
MAIMLCLKEVAVNGFSASETGDFDVKDKVYGESSKTFEDEGSRALFGGDNSQVQEQLAGKSQEATKASIERKPRMTPRHPTYGAMIESAIRDLKDRRGASRQAIFKYIVDKYEVPDDVLQINARIRSALRRGLLSGRFMQATGSGAAGRIHLAEMFTCEATLKAVRKLKTKSSRSMPEESAVAIAITEVKKEESPSPLIDCKVEA